MLLDPVLEVLHKPITQLWHLREAVVSHDHISRLREAYVTHRNHIMYISLCMLQFMRDALRFPEDGCYLAWWFHSMNIKGQIEEGWIKQSWRADAQLMHTTQSIHRTRVWGWLASCLNLIPIISLIFPFLSNKSKKKAHGLLLNKIIAYNMIVVYDE